jgi:hypothetical protein
MKRGENRFTHTSVYLNVLLFIVSNDALEHSHIIIHWISFGSVAGAVSDYGGIFGPRSRGVSEACDTRD